MPVSEKLWPELDYRAWQDTATALHLWTQIVGKVRLQLAPWLNHSWQVALYVTSRGLGTSAIPVGGEVLEIEFDFIAHELELRSSTGAKRTLALAPQPVCEFYGQFRQLLHDMGVRVSIWEVPNELPNPIPFSQDRSQRPYDKRAAHDFWRVLTQANRLLHQFRTGFLGKASPVHFFWGSFDLAVTRFSGRRAPTHPGGVPGLPDAVAREAYSHECSSAGFWPGNERFPKAAFYSYSYPESPGFRQQAVPAGAYFEAQLGEFILPYDVVRTSSDPDGLVLEFLSMSYQAAASTGHWDRDQLECPRGVAGRVRAVPIEGR